MRTISSLVAALLIVGIAPAHAVDARTYERRVVRAVNAVREPNVARSECVRRQAQQRARNLRGRDYGDLSHSRAAMTATALACGGWWVGENIMRSTLSPREVVRLWMKSDGHRTVMLRREYDVIGVGVVRDGEKWLVVAQFMAK